jgi:endoglucanase
LLLQPVISHANCLDAKPLRGLNISGAELNGSKLPGRHGFDYIYPDARDIRQFASLGATALRIPINWARLQPTPYGDLDASELSRLSAVVKLGQELDLCIIVDAHNYGGHGTAVLGTAELPGRALSDFWIKVAAAIPYANHVAFGLMNEPAKLQIPAWAAIAKQTVLDLRKNGSPHLLLVSGGRWSGAHEWFKSIGGDSNANAFATLVDPLNRIAIEVHQYADQYGTGTKTDCIAAARMEKILSAVADWGTKNNKRLFLGEFGTSNSPECIATLRTQIESASDVQWAGWTYWAAGRWWSKSYPFNAQPLGSEYPPQLSTLIEFFH